MPRAPLRRLHTCLRAAQATPAGQRAVRVGRPLLVAAVLAWLAYQVSTIGWGAVGTALPRTPWFYAIFVVMYLQLPVLEAWIYRALWQVPARRVLPVLLRKRILNAEVVNYSGEVYLYAQATRLSTKEDGFLGRTIKDNLLVSSVASTGAAILLVGGAFLSGALPWQALTERMEPWMLSTGVLLAVLLGGAGWALRRRVFTLPDRLLAFLLGVHGLRFALMFGWQILQWWVVVPEAPLSVWVTMLAVITVVNRVPFLPARDLLSAGAILGVADVLAAPEAAIAGLLLTRSALDRLAHLALYAATSRRRPLPAEPATPVVAVSTTS